MDNIAVEIKKKMTKHMLSGCLIIGIVILLVAGFMAWKCLSPILKQADMSEALG
jgi:hypothetical protein